MKDLTHLASDLIRKLAEAAVAELRARYEMSRVVAALRLETSTNRGAARALSSLLHVDASALRRLARVGATVGPDEFEALVAIRLADGRPLTWSHIEMLTMVRSSAQRRALAQTFAGRSVPVRTLAALVRAQRQSPLVAFPAQASPGAPPGVSLVGA